MLSDPIADMLTVIRNGYSVGKTEIKISYSKLKERLGQVLVTQGYLGKIQHRGKELVVALRYKDNQPTITKVIKVSKPGLRVYVNKREIPKVLSGIGACILSTPQGVMTGKEARKKGLGGEIICKIW